ncbi:anthranilate synthase component I family protein [soil metagenome]
MLPLVEELIPCPDPWDVARKLSHLPHLLFLDSAERHTERGRYSYVMADPIEVFTSTTSPFPILPNAATHPALPPFQGGWAGVFGYELGRRFERQPHPRSNALVWQDLCLCRYDWVIAFDHLLERAWIVVQDPTPLIPRMRFEDAQHRMRLLKRMLYQNNEATLPRFETDTFSTVSIRESRTSDFPLQVRTSNSEVVDIASNFTRDDYITAVRKCIDYIHAGDIFQVNLSQRLLAPLTEHPLELYGRLRTLNPAPFACYFDAGEFQIVSASPERFLQVTADRSIITKPIKGTRPRGKTPAEDAALIADLLTNPKDRAENVMIVDLLRNDIGKVAEYGSVTVPKVCELESYPYVHHLVSEVRGKLRTYKTPFDLLKAAFPGGSVTGAPKVRAMEIIAELEPTARGPYCGSVGFIGFDGVMDTNILIRTFTAAQGWLQFPVGGGIVADSDPEAEHQETLDKAAGLLRALKKES